MDRFIAQYPARPDGDLMQCGAFGVAYQADRTHLVDYDAAYYDRCAGYEGQDIALAINAGRIALVAKHHGDGPAVDIGIGSGEFIKRRGNTWGHDVNPVAIAWLERHDLWAADLRAFRAFTMFDVIEHVETPEDYLRHIPVHGWAFFSLPIFQDLERVRESRHYRPGEHLQYFTAGGFEAWLVLHGFSLRDHQTFEMDAGREDIHSFAFQRIGPPA